MNACGHFFREIGVAEEIPHVSSHVKDKVRLLNEERPSSGPALRLNRAAILLKIRPKQLL